MIGLGLLGRVFGSPKAIGAAARSVRDGLDALVYTKEEQAGDEQKDAADARAVLVRWLDASKGQNLARRIIGVGVFAMWAMMWGGAAFFHVASIWVETNARWTATSGALSGYATEINSEFMLVLGFYFAAPHLGKFAEVLSQRNAKK